MYELPCVIWPPTVLYWPAAFTPAVRCTEIVTVSAVILAVLLTRTCSSLNQPLLLVTRPVAVTEPPVDMLAWYGDGARDAAAGHGDRAGAAGAPVLAVALIVTSPLPEPLAGEALSQL